MSIKLIYDRSLISLLNTIFYESPSETDEFLPIIKDAKNISEIIPFLGSDINIQINLNNNISLIFYLKNIFSENDDLMPVFIKLCNKNKITFIQALINIYLNDKIKDQSLTLIEDLLSNITYKVSVCRSIFEYIYQKLNIYFNINQNIQFNETTVLTEALLLKYLKLLRIFYTDIKSECEDTENKSTKDEDKIIRNFIYFNGENSGMTMSLNKETNNINVDTPTLSEGFSLIFYINLNRAIIDEYFSNILSAKKAKITLAKFIVNSHYISLELKDPDTVIVIIDDSESNHINIAKAFKYDMWNCVMLLIEPKSSKKKMGVVKVSINESLFLSTVFFPKNFNTNDKIDSIVLFENLIGKVTSIISFSFLIENKLMSFFNTSLYAGFHKNKILFKFLHSLDKDYCKNIQNCKYYEKYKTDKNMAKVYNINIGLKDINKNKIISILCPFMYNHNTKIIDDVFGIFLGKLKSEGDGVCVYSNNTKNIGKLGGINNLLPIAELMLSSLKDNTNILVDKNLLTENTLLEYLIIIKQILKNHKENIIEINNNYFFSSLGLLLEKYPSNIFTIEILNIFLEICKETLKFNTGAQSNTENLSLKYRFISIIIFNTKIIAKFSFENQLKIWEGIYNYFKTDNNMQIKDALDIPKIINLLRFYDQDRYQKYCCKKHASLFGNTDVEIMKPELNVRIGKLYDIIQLYIEKSELEKDQFHLYNILSLDLSSCMKKKVLQMYIFYFINDKISDKSKEKNFCNLLGNNYFEITEYMISISLLDIRTEILKLLHIFLIKYKDKIVEYLQKSSQNESQVISYISHNILPTEIRVNPIEEGNNQNVKTGNYYSQICYKDNLFGKVEDKNFLQYYFNKKNYEDDLNTIWRLLNSWMTDTSTVKTVQQPNTSTSKSTHVFNIFKKEKDSNKYYEEKFSLLINPFVLSFSIDFVSHVKPIFIDSFINCINDSLKEHSTQNKDVVIKDKKFFQWLIDTIFFFHNKENESIIEEKEFIPSIKKNSLELLLQILKLKTTIKEIETKLYYFMEYSFFFKKKYNENSNNLKEILRITRLILEEMLQSPDYFNIKTIICFEFIFFYQQCEKILSNYNYVYRRSSLIDNVSLNKLLKKRSKDESDMHDINKNLRKDSMTLYDYESNNESVNISINRTIVEGNDPENFEINNLIPDYYYQGIYNIKQAPNQNKAQNNSQTKKIENNWVDYNLYNSIIEHYRNNIWGPEVIFKMVKMQYDPKKPLLEQYQQILIYYGDTKDYRNILFKSITKLVIIDDNYQDPINKINILYLNLILLCFSYDISGNVDDQEKLNIKLDEFLIFCILASVNINQTEETFNYIQKKLYDTLSFGLFYLQGKDIRKYLDLMSYIIHPFFELMPGKKKAFGSKKNLYKNTAIYRVFIKSDADTNLNEYDRIPTRMDDQFHPTNQGLSSSLPKKKVTISGKEGRNSIKNKNANKKKKNNALLLSNNAINVIEGIFTRVLNFYKEKKYLFNSENNLIMFYFKNEKHKEKNEEKNKNFIEKMYDSEKKRINMFMKKLIPDIFNEIQKSSISSYLEEKKRRNQFKKIKKSLFSWSGFWTDKNLFLSHPELLKYKIKNHYCKDMSKILLSPILDLKYYLPKFSKFNASTLFNKEDYKYHICMNVDEIVNINSKPEADDSNNGFDDNNGEYIKYNENNFNYLESLYKNQYNNIWEIYYTNYMEQKKSNNNDISLTANKIFELLFQNKLITVNEDSIKNENIYNCCMVKPTHHIKGYITTEKNSLKFTYCPDNESKEALEKDPSYDMDMGACFGSTFKTYHKDKDKICFEIKYESIEYMFKRNYFYQETGLEIFTFERKSYFLNFKSNQELLKFLADITQHEKFRTIKCHGFKGKKLLGYCKLFNVYTKKTSHYINNKMEEWQNNTISTYEYLMWLNIFAGRSFNDLTQYPVFPWIITNYQASELNENEDFRNLSIPVGMFDMNEKAEARKETFIDFYNTLKNDLKESMPDFDYQSFLEKFDGYIEHYNHKKLKNKDENNQDETEVGKIQLNQLPYFYGSHYSNPTYVSHYLTRLFPHASISIEIHGDKFDDPNRMFISLSRTFETASTLKDDVRELIPEFYILPEMFMNINNFNLSQDKLDSEGQKIVINNVELPLWANNKSTNFVIEMRKNLEKNSLKINKWVDLIFGCAQKGEKAEENNNIFMLNTYENIVKIEEIKDVDEKNALMRLVEVGVTPIQILSSESKPRNDLNQILAKSPYSNSKGAFLWESTDLRSFNINMYKYHKLILKLTGDYKKNKENEKTILPRVLKIKAIHKNELRIFTNLNYWFNIKFIRGENKYIIEESSLRELPNISSQYGPSYSMSNIQAPLVLFGNNKYMIKGGFWDGRIEINIITSDKDEKENLSFSIHINEGPVTCMEISKDENILLCGTLYGYIIAFKIEIGNAKTNVQLNLMKKVFAHSDSINSISINDNLNLIATSANDEYVNLYILPTFENFRTIKVQEKKTGNNEQEEVLVANNVFLSSSPLPCISFFINSRGIFKSFTINGDYIGKNKESDGTKTINCYIIFHDLNFCDYLLYGTDDGMVKIRSFPELNLINCYKPFDGLEISCLEISFDKRYCYAWSKGGEIAVIKDASVNDPTEVEQKKLKLK